MKRFLATLLLASAAAVAFAQNSLIRPRMEIAEFEENGISLEVFYMDGDIVQIQFDPLYELFIPLGNTLEESIGKMEEIKEYYAQPRLWTTEITGRFAVAYPNDEPVSVTVTSRRLLTSKLLEFSLPSPDDLVRGTLVTRGQFNSLVNSLRFYRKIHPKEQ